VISPVQNSKSAKFGPYKMRRGFGIDPCLARVRREQKAAVKDARFGAHFTQMYRFSALWKGAVGTSLPDKAGASLVLAKGCALKDATAKNFKTLYDAFCK
jgi:hypothetical protein